MEPTLPLSANLSTKKTRRKTAITVVLVRRQFFRWRSVRDNFDKIGAERFVFSTDRRKQNSFVAESILIMTTLIHLEKSGLAKKNITDDDVDRFCLKILFDRSPLIDIFNQECRKSLSAMLEVKEAEEQLMIPLSLCNWLRRLM